jgi:hypothetical protein
MLSATKNFICAAVRPIKHKSQFHKARKARKITSTCDHSPYATAYLLTAYTMKFCKNLQRVVDISDTEWAPYWTNYKMLKVRRSSFRSFMVVGGGLSCLVFTRAQIQCDYFSILIFSVLNASCGWIFCLIRISGSGRFMNRSLSFLNALAMMQTAINLSHFACFLDTTNHSLRCCFSSYPLPLSSICFE